MHLFMRWNDYKAFFLSLSCSPPVESHCVHIQVFFSDSCFTICMSGWEEKEFRVIFREDNMALFWLYMRYFRLTRSSFLSVLCFDRATGERENMKKKIPSCSIVVALWQASWALCYEEEGMKSLILGCHHSVWWTRIRSSHHTRLHNSIV